MNGILRRLVGMRPYLEEPDKRLPVKIAQKGSARTHQSYACPARARPSHARPDGAFKVAIPVLTFV